MILSCAAMRALEERAFADGITADALMEEAGALIATHVCRTFPNPGVALAVFGKGNNGGDALVAARHLAAIGWEVRLIPAFPRESWGELVQAKAELATACTMDSLTALEDARGTPLVILDGLLGIGASGPLRPPISDFTQAMNALRERSHAHTFALDLPTGLDGDHGLPDPHCIIADTTLTIGFAKSGLVADEAANFVGRLRVLPLEDLSLHVLSALGARVLVPARLARLLPRRKFDTHKGDYGRVGILAGSPGMLGAAAMCASAAVRAGAGLVTLYTASESAFQLSVMVPHEVMVRAVKTFHEVDQHAHHVFAIGPGLGAHQADEICGFLRESVRPVVVDADAINALAKNPTILHDAPGPRILTPHPGEMARLAPDLAQLPRAEIVRNFLHRYPQITLLLKGARTVIGHGDEPLAFNSTGTPGMATGGMGDILTGVIAALVGQGLAPFEAAQLGAWLCGRAGEIAVDSGGETDETLRPTRLLDFLADAFADLRSEAHGRP